MKVKNNTNKPIGIGVLNLLPGKTETLPAPYKQHPIVRMLATKKYDEEHTFITLTEEESDKEDATPTSNGSVDSTSNTGTLSVSALKRLGKAKLEEMAKEAGIEVENPTVDKLAEAIYAAQEQKPEQGADNGSDE